MDRAESSFHELCVADLSGDHCLEHDQAVAENVSPAAWKMGREFIVRALQHSRQLCCNMGRAIVCSCDCTAQPLFRPRIQHA